MKTKGLNQKNYLQRILLFSFVGVFCYLLLLNSDNSYPEKISLLHSPLTCVIFISIFNMLGFVILRMNDYLIKMFPSFYGRGGWYLWNFILLAIIFLFLHFVLFFLLKWILGFKPLFYIGPGSLQLIFSVWLLGMIIIDVLNTNYTMRHMLDLYKAKQRSEELAVKIQYQALQHQLNPHFLFNSLNTLVAAIQYDPDKAVVFTQKLSEVYRYVLQQEDRQLVSLQEELDFMDSYIFLQKVRLGDCLYVKKYLTEEACQAKVPALTLQVLIENVFKHNDLDEDNPIDVIIRTSPDNTFLSVSNDLRPKQEVLSSGKGLNNLRERYKLVGDRNIKIESTENTFTVLIPLIYE